MNLKGLTKEQRGELRSRLKRDLELGERTRLMPLLEASVGRVAANATRRQLANLGRAASEHEGLMAVAFSMPRADDLDHIIDWLRGSLLENADWLRNVDACGYPRKLMKCATYEDLVREANKSMDRLNAQRAKALGVHDECHLADLDDGYTLVRLLTPAALDLESRRMHHCVGHGAYDRDLVSGDIQIVSLRDPDGRPAVTIEVSMHGTKYRDGTARIEQAQGRRNERPERRHLDQLKPWVLSTGYDGEHRCWPRARDIDGRMHDLYAIPPGARFGDLQVYPVDAYGELRLPDGLLVEGELELRPFHARILLGARTVVTGAVRVLNGMRWGALQLPEDLEVGGSISVSAASGVIAPARLQHKVQVAPGHLDSFHSAIFGRPVGDEECVWPSYDAVAGTWVDLAVDDNEDAPPAPRM